MPSGLIGVSPVEGQNISLEYILNGVRTNRIKMYLGLMTNAAGLTDASIHANITTPTGAGGYAIKELTDGSWTISSLGSGLGYKGVFPIQTFTPSGAAYSADVTGFYIYADDNASGDRKSVV